MVFAINLRWTSFKQNINDVEEMLQNQIATYAILRYATDIPESAYRKAMNMLLADTDRITNKKLKKLLRSYAGVAKVGIVMDEELVETIIIPPYNAGFIEEGKPRGYSLMIEEEDED